MASSQKITVGPLKNIPGVQRELARVYRAARRGQIPTDSATRLAGILNDIRRCLVVEDGATQPRALGWRTPIETKS